MQVTKLPKLPRKYNKACKLNDEHIAFIRSLYIPGVFGYEKVRKAFIDKYFPVSDSVIPLWCKSDEERSRYYKLRYKRRKAKGYKTKYSALNNNDRWKRKKALYPEQMKQFIKYKDEYYRTNYPEAYKAKNKRGFEKFKKLHPDYLRNYMKSYMKNYYPKWLEKHPNYHAKYKLKKSKTPPNPI